jgi:DNA-binding NarL/FixJ family response regulator
MRSSQPQRIFLLADGNARGFRARRFEPPEPSPASTERPPALTPRQRDVAALLVETGLSYKEIAARLGRSEGTVRTHTEKIYRACGVHSRAELTVALRPPEYVPSGDAVRRTGNPVRSTRPGC